MCRSINICRPLQRVQLLAQYTYEFTAFRIFGVITHKLCVNLYSKYTGLHTFYVRIMYRSIQHTYWYCRETHKRYALYIDIYRVYNYWYLRVSRIHIQSDIIKQNFLINQQNISRNIRHHLKGTRHSTTPLVEGNKSFIVGNLIFCRHL